MKKVFLLIFTVITAFSFYSCTKDKESENNFLKYGDAYGDLTKGYIVSDYDGDGYYDQELILTGPSIKYDKSEDEFIGSDSWIVLDLETKSSSLANGVYVYGEEIYDVEVSMSGNPEDYGYDEIASGRLSVSKGKIEFHFFTYRGIEISGCYEGELSKINW